MGKIYHADQKDFSADPTDYNNLQNHYDLSIAYVNHIYSYNINLLSKYVFRRLMNCGLFTLLKEAISVYSKNHVQLHFKNGSSEQETNRSMDYMSFNKQYFMAEHNILC